MPDAEGLTVPTTEHATEPERYIVRSELMQHYTTAQPIRLDEPVLLSARDAAGEVQLYSLGDDGELYYIFPTQRATTGWAIRAMGAPVAVRHAAVGSERLGPVLMLVAGDDGHVHFTTDEPWSPWVDLGAPFGAMSVAGLRAGYGVDGELIFQAIARIGTQQIVLRIYPRDADNPWDYVSPYITGEIYDCVPGASPLGVGTVLSASYQNLGLSRMTWYRDHQQCPVPLYSSQTDDMVKLGGVRDADGITRVFCLSEQRTLYAVDVEQGPGEQLQPFDTEYFSGEAIAVMGFDCGMTHTGDNDRLLQVFALGFPSSAAGPGQTPSTISLYRASQQYPIPEPDPLDGPGVSTDVDEASVAPVWGPFVALADGLAPASGNLTTCRDGKGFTQGFTVGADGVVMHFWQDTDSDWKIEPITFDFVGELAEVPAYSTEITVVDALDNPVTGYPVTVSAAQSMAVSINGRAYQVGPGGGAIVASNAAGRITIVSPTSSLGTPGFQLAASFMAEGVVTILPDRYIQNYLYVENTPDSLAELLRTEKYVPAGSDTSVPLVPPANQSQAGAAADAIWQSMSLAQPTQGDSEARARVLSPRSDRSGVEVLPAGAFGDRIDPRRVGAQAWHIAFDDDGLRFERLKDKAARDQLVARLAVGTVPETELFSLHIPKPDWGSLWHNVRRGATRVSNIVVAAFSSIEGAVTTVVDRIEATIATIVDGVETLLTYVVDTVQQVFDIVQQVFAAIATPFTALFRWLGTLFDWTRIVSVQGWIADTLQTGIDTTLPGALEGLRHGVDTFLDDLLAQLQQHPPQDPTTPVGQAQAQAVASADQAPGPSANWVENQMVGSNGGQPLEATDPGDPDASAVSTFVQSVEDAFGELFQRINLQLHEAIAQQRALAEVTAGEVFQAAITLLAETAIDAVKAAVDSAFALLEFTLAEVGAFVTARWHIPVVSQLFARIFERDLTLLDLIALALAVPTTFIGGALGRLPPTVDAARTAGRKPLMLEDTDDAITASQLAGIVYTGSQTLYGPFAAAAALAQIESKWLRSVPAMFSLAGLIINCPVDLLEKDTDELDASQWITVGCYTLKIANWGIGQGLPLAIDVLTPGPSRPQPALKTAGSLFSCVSNVLLLGGYGVQSVLQIADPSTYLPDHPNDVVIDVGLKFAQNVFSVAPGALAPLGLPYFDEVGGPIVLAGAQLVGNVGAGLIGLFRDSLAIGQGYFNHMA